MRIYKAVTEEDRKMRLPLWAAPFVVVGTLLISYMFDHFGKSALARPTIYAAAIFIITVAMRWKLRKYGWFWITMTILAALHVPLILFVPWTAKWIPVLVVIPIGIADSYAMLWVISIVRTFMVESKKRLNHQS